MENKLKKVFQISFTKGTNYCNKIYYFNTNFRFKKYSHEKNNTFKLK